MDRISRGDAWRREFIARNGFRCFYCNRTGGHEIGPDQRPWHIDHMIPLASGGADEESNLALACKRCNLTKGRQHYQVFQQFAHEAFWVPADGRPSEHELDYLMSNWTSSGCVGKCKCDTTWRLNPDDLEIFNFNCDGEIDLIFRAALPNAWENTKKEAGQAMHLIEMMHKSLPVLISEIRILRAELAEAKAGAA